MMKKTVLTAITISLLSSAYAQTFINKGANVAVMTGAVMIVKSDNVTTGSGSLENDAQTSGAFKNKGRVIIEGSFVNTSGTADGYAANTGEYRVQKDWVNNGTFTADNSTVTLYGPAQQITGSNPTTFFNLRDTLGVKTQTVDASVAGVLSLYTTEHATDDYKLTILNTDPAAITQDDVNKAFVSSNGTAGIGRLVRNTDRKAEYLFPTGVNGGGITPKIREASVTPPNTTARSYSIRYADRAPVANTTTNEGQDTSIKAPNVTLVNGDYYHLVSASDPAPADLALYFDQAADHAWNSMGRWQSNSTNFEWEDLKSASVLPGLPLSGRVKMVRSAWIPTADQAHALIDSISIKKDFNFPTAFIPDATGVPVENTYFTIINQGDLVTLEELSVFNRWGEMVFNNKRDGTDKWNGHYQGKLQLQGNYVYLAKVRNKVTGTLYPTVTGNLSLIW
jgi:gliding motility-associated-like protein